MSGLIFLAGIAMGAGLVLVGIVALSTLVNNKPGA